MAALGYAEKGGGGGAESTRACACARELQASAQQTRERGKNGMGDRRFHS